MQIPNELGISFIANPETPYATNTVNAVFIGLDTPATKLDLLLPAQHYLHPAAPRITRALDILELRKSMKDYIEMDAFEVFCTALSFRLYEELKGGEDVLAEAHPGRPPHPLGQGVALSTAKYAQKQAYLEHHRKTDLEHYGSDVVNNLSQRGTNWPMAICRAIIPVSSAPLVIKKK
ncbi:MAG TPA: hypothetical protein VHP58_02095 [Alphaproteobacteria bacterium]|nr:hypothetical protein [Alphaproteobacteria bacterium]